MLRTISALLFFCLVSSFSYAQLLRTDGQRIVNDRGENIILRGFGLGGWMLQEGYMMKVQQEGQQYRIRERIRDLIGEEKTAAFYDAWLANHTRKIDVDSLKAWGFNSIRLPMHYDLYTLASDAEPVPGQQTWLDKGFNMTDSLLAWCKANQMYLILDLHAAPGGQGHDLNIADRNPGKPSLWENRADQEKTIALWRKLAERYANEPWIGGYDLINEPNWGFTDPVGDKNGTKEKNNAPIGQLQQEITKAIREVDTKHIVIVEGNGWGNNYSGFDPDWDDNLVLSFHKYWNYNDTASISHILRLRNQYNKPAWLGETGENSNVWFTQAISLFEDNNIGWAWWPLKKIGFNNPMEIPSNPGYDSLVSFINGRQGAKPPVDIAYTGLMKLAEDSKLEHTIKHPDVVDAMIRQPFTTATKPFKPHTAGTGQWIQAVDYDLGRNGYAYLDMDTANYRVSTGKNSSGNRGRQYRNDGVDIRQDSLEQGTYVVTHIEDGEWLQYTIQVPRAGKFQLVLQAAAGSAGGRVLITDQNGKALTKEISLPATGGLHIYKSTKAMELNLGQGSQSIRLLAVKGGFNLKSLQLK